MTTTDLTFAVRDHNDLEKAMPYRRDHLDVVEDNIDRQNVLQHYASRND
jgi:hypothetical protein